MAVTGASFPRYIAIDGPIGVGKTTLAHLLAKHLHARVVLEEFEDNPFLREFYRDKARAAFQTQVYFLLARYKQQEALRQPDLFNRAMVSDYLFAKDRIFAYLNLSEPELQLYEKIYDLLRPRLMQPELVIFLQARPEVLMRRLRKRGRDIETTVEVSYLESLVRAYNDFFHRYEESPLLVVETSEIDFLGDSAQFEALLESIRATTSGRRVHVPAPATVLSRAAGDER